ncbi:Sdh8 protein [Pichia kluyveri]|uniref:Succinate dehydrogenase assembly factor 4, mitochondrial n=1 Tax=Pichia kluyveri TaxID=36015 RepID=A0AAV5RB20_PICKL|nr:Sdh8 protein [Pichia kluyveri]
MQSYKSITRLVVQNTRANIRLYSSGNPFSSKGPSPPELDPEEQKEFEKLQQAANTQIAIEQYNEDHGFKTEAAPPKVSTSDVGSFVKSMQTIPEFDGNVNPKTGEVNGPKQDPVRHGDWSFNGRVTDF